MRRTGTAMWLLLLLCGALALAPAAVANDVDFACGATSGAAIACTGTVTNTSNNFTTSGITVYNDSGPYSTTSPFTPFTLSFNTNTTSTTTLGGGIIAGSGNGTISITNATNVLAGSFTGFSYTPGRTTATLTLAGVIWTTLPAIVQNYLGTPNGVDNGTVTFLLANGTAQSVDILITPTPEPTSLALLGSGLLMGAGMLRRKLIRR